MISLIERGQSSPTAVVLEKLAGALGVTLSSLFEPAPEAPPPSALAKRAGQPRWRDPASGYERRNVSPPGMGHPMEIVEVRFPPDAQVAFENAGRARQVQQVWVLAGAIEITAGQSVHQLHEGDCLAMRLDAPTVFHNPYRKTARYAVVIANEHPAPIA